METAINNQQGNQYRYLIYLVSIYSFLFLLPSILLRKVIHLPYVGTIPISILFTGTYFVLLDVITDVYGYYIARRVLIAGLITYTIFVFMMEMVVHIHSPVHYDVEWSSVQDPDAYVYLFRDLYLVWFSVVICVMLANTLNIVILSKWKILVQGKYFWFRSIMTSLVAAIIYSSLSNLFAFGFFLHASQIPYYFELVAISVGAKLTTLVICAYPATLLCYFLKRKENVDVYDYGISYNLFKAQPKNL
jgi:uncharacterized PurR-regulated membrane protein YhhQ (DUF165 family)